MIVSPGVALLIAHVIDRHGLSFDTQQPWGTGKERGINTIVRDVELAAMSERRRQENDGRQEDDGRVTRHGHATGGALSVLA
jgi:hypothetical protein